MNDAVQTTKRRLCGTSREGYTKNQAVKNMPMASRTIVRWGNTAGLTGLVYLVIASSSCSQSKDKSGIKLSQLNDSFPRPGLRPIVSPESPNQSDLT